MFLVPKGLWLALSLPSWERLRKQGLLDPPMTVPDTFCRKASSALGCWWAICFGFRFSLRCVWSAFLDGLSVWISRSLINRVAPAPTCVVQLPHRKSCYSRCSCFMSVENFAKQFVNLLLKIHTAMPEESSQSTNDLQVAAEILVILANFV